MFKYIIIALSAFGVGTAFMPHAAAIVQGTLGTTSTMIINVQIQINREVRIFGINTIGLGAFDFDQPQTQGESSFCVHDSGASFGAGFTYSITFTGANNPGAFVLQAGGNTIAYSVAYDDSLSGTNFRPVSPGVALTGNLNAAPSAISCIGVGGENGRTRITVLRADALGAPNNTYTDTLSILITPDV